MTNNNEISYFKIGTFVLIGLGMMIFALLVFSSGKLFQPIIYVETYFDESIQGISEGTPVKYRGLQIGYIDNIAFADEIYPNLENLGAKIYSRSIYVKIAITSKLFTRLPGIKARKLLTDEVEHGLRVKLVSQGLTGISYLEFNYVDPTSNPIPSLTWAPKYVYVPSVPSTLTRLSENAQYVMNELKDVNFKKLFSDLNELTASFSQVLVKTESSLNQINNPLVTVLQNFKTISDNLKTISEQLKVNPSALTFGKPPPPLNLNKI